ncbi:CST complex subunit CTC1 [Oreochromis niloticus]|uniref:CST complex subunit CTC1 n=1 Tax=Oreochromis niloticus TaxID=8128 RepID=UPI000DF1A48D|nr:CST complex subunit CTC1-like [Oreochromis niloticus]
MLCTCLGSSLRVTAFSRVGGSPPDNRCPGDGALPRLLLQRNTDVSDYLWTCHLSSQLAHSLVQGVWRQQCVCLLSWRLMETQSRPGGRGRRDIYSEMLDEPHTCPVTQYSVSSAVRRYLGVSELLESLQTDCWSSAPLSSLLPGLCVRQRPLLLVGVLELPSQTSEFKHSMQLRDATGAAA